MSDKNVVKNVVESDVSVNVKDFMEKLTAAKSTSGSSAKVWRLDVEKMLLNSQKIGQQPLQARTLVLALCENMEAAKAGFTLTQWAEWADAAGLETRQGSLRICRYYVGQLKVLCLDSK